MKVHSLFIRVNVQKIQSAGLDFKLMLVQLASTYLILKFGSKDIQSKYLMSLVAHQFGHVKFRILVLIFSTVPS